MRPLLEFEAAVARAVAQVAPLPAETVSIDDDLRGMVLAAPARSSLIQPPADVSAMDGYAVRASDLPGTLNLVGESAAGHPFVGGISTGECVRIFTGAILPKGTDAIAIQENCAVEGNAITSAQPLEVGRYVRRKGCDFDSSASLPAGTLLTARTLALAAAMDNATVQVHRRPRVAILSTGDEIKLPGEPRATGQIVSSNHITLAALVRQAGGLPTVLPIASDDPAVLAQRMAQFTDFDLAIVSGGASVGDHDLVKPTLEHLGATLDFWRIAMRPGKPLMVAKLGDCPVLGLPGNPVSSYITGLLFAVPMIRAMLGRTGPHLRAGHAKLCGQLPPNDQRREFMRARLDGSLITPVSSQDSSLLSRLGTANALIDRPAHGPAVEDGGRVAIYLLDDW